MSTGAWARRAVGQRAEKPERNISMGAAYLSILEMARLPGLKIRR
jgi:soluble lytic murein transglycosylase-like protein